MKKIYNLIWTLTFGLFLAGCDSDDSVTAGEGGIIRSNVTFTAQGGNGSVETTFDDPTALSDQAWCTATVSGSTVTVTVPVYTNLLGRTAMLTIRSGSQSVSLPVSQEGVRIVGNRTSVTAPIAGSTERILIGSNLDWSVSIPDTITWCSAVRSADTIIITFSPNEGRPRSTTATISGNGTDLKTVPLDQKGVIPVNELFTTSEDDWFFNPAQMSAMFKSYFNAANTDVGILIGEKIDNMYLGPDATQTGTHEYSFIFGDYQASFYLNTAMVTETNDQIKLTFTGKGDQAGNAVFLYNETTSFKNMVTLMIRNPFKLTVNDPENPTAFTFTDAIDPRVSFTLVNTPVQIP